MDSSVPKSAGLLLDFIASFEAPKGYDTVYGNNQKKLPQPLTSMTLGEVISSGSHWTKTFGSSACGRYQFMSATLKDLQSEMGLEDSETFDDDFQDRLGFKLLRRRGYDGFMSGRTSRTAFGLGLAQEWASFPVLQNCTGAHRRVVRGQSFYAGDGLNKALVAPDKVEKALADALAAAKAPSTATVPAKAPAKGMSAVVHLAQVDAGETPDAAPEGSPPMPLPAEPVAPGLSPALIAATQQRLLNKGYYAVGTPNGDPGVRTVAAVSMFQHVAGMPVTGQIDQATLDKIWSDEAPDAPVSDERASVTAADLRGKSTIATAAWGGKIEAGWKAGLGGGGLFLTFLSECTDDVFAKFQKANDALGGHGGAVAVAGLSAALVLLAYTGWKRAQTVETAKVAEVASGKAAS